MSSSDVVWQSVAEAFASARVGGAEAGIVKETHISFVLVGTTLVYKLKKPDAPAPTDYSTRERRREMCERELRLNQRLAPTLYVGVRGVMPDGARFRLCELDDPHCLEPVLVMRRVDDRRTLERMVDTMDAHPSDLQAVGSALGGFHASAASAPNGTGSPDRLESWLQALVGLIRADGETVVSTEHAEAACAFLERWFAVERELFVARVQNGFIRDCHGDLRLNHVVLGDSGVEVLDCVEFSDELRQIDVLADLSFLVMELQFAVREDLTRALVRAWRTVVGPFDERLLWVYACSRAMIRVEVGLARVHQLRRAGPSLELQVAEERTQTLLELAIRLSWRARAPRAIVFGGLSGSGKTRISSVLATRWGLERFSSDEIRKRLAGVGRDDVAPDHAYDDYVSREVYERLGREAGREIAAGRSAVVDATFHRAVDAQAFVRALRAAGSLSGPLTLACTAPSDELRRRVRERAERGGSDASLDVLEGQLKESHSAPLGISDTVDLPTGGELADAIERAERLVLDLTVVASPR